MSDDKGSNDEGGFVDRRGGDETGRPSALPLILLPVCSNLGYGALIEAFERTRYEVVAQFTEALYWPRTP